MAAVQYCTVQRAVQYSTVQGAGPGQDSRTDARPRPSTGHSHYTRGKSESNTFLGLNQSLDISIPIRKSK